ncbi:MAG TPA: sensor histidine kinase [Actinomycetota bacterium]
MTDRTSRRLAWSLWVLAIAIGAASAAYQVASWSTPAPPGSFGFRGFAMIFGVAFGTTGAIIASRHPRNPIGWVFLGMAVLSSIQELANEYAIWAIVQEGGGHPLEEVAAWIPAWIWIPGTSGAMFLLLLFPDGRIPSPRWRWVLIVGSIGAIVGAIGFALLPGPLENFGVLDNPFAVGTRGMMATLAIVGQFLYGVGIVLSAGALIGRYRAARGDERQQLKWLATGGSFLALSLFASFVIQAARPQTFARADQLFEGQLVALLVIAGFTSVPVATAFAMLRYRLYAIDLVIKKTVVYTVLAILLFAIGLPLAWALGSVALGLVGPSHEAYGFALAGLIVGVLIWPLRRVAVRIADRVVYGRRATPYEVLSDFSGRVAEAYAADDVLERMAQVLGEAVGADAATVWLGEGGHARPVATWPFAAPVDHALPETAVEVRHQGAGLGALSVRMPVNDPMNPTKERLIRDLAGQAGLVLRNATLIEDLKASRQRLVAAQDAERRRIERNIHDGSQQQLVALAVKLGLTERLVATDPPRAVAMLGELQRETNQALEDLRDLARGIYPPLLADKGLSAALQSQARKSTIPVAVETDGIPRYPQELEAAVYFSCLEALQNIAKYARASRATVRLARSNGFLRFEVEDDGVGSDPATAPRGTGLQGIADRLAALGGEVTIRSAPGDGTTVTGRLPIGEAMS